MIKIENESIFDINKEIIEQHINKGLDIVASNYDLKEVETGKFANIQIQDISYSIKQYEINGVGNLLVMDSKDSIQLQMASFVITPYYKSLPLFSTDYMYIQEKRINTIHLQMVIEFILLFQDKKHLL